MRLFVYWTLMKLLFKLHKEQKLGYIKEGTIGSSFQKILIFSIAI